MRKVLCLAVLELRYFLLVLLNNSENIGKPKSIMILVTEVKDGLFNNAFLALFIN